MEIQYLSDSNGKKTGVFIPIDYWDKIKSQIESLLSFEKKKEIDIQSLNGLKTALEEVKMHQQGEIILETARKLFDEV